MRNTTLLFRPEIEGLRAVAILLVVLDHAGVPGFHGGFVGVDVFFVISGFLITRILAQPQPPRLRDFYAARLRRLLPALIVMLVLTSLLAMLLLAPVEQRAQARAAGAASLWLSNFWFAANGQDYFATGADQHLFQHTWSLGVEEQFYLLWPALILAFAVRAKWVRILTLSIVLVASLVLCIVGTGSMPLESYYLLPARFWQFAAGGLLAIGLERHASALSAHAASLAGAIGVLGLAAASTAFDGSGYPGWLALVPTLAALALIAAGTRTGTLVPRLLSHRVPMWIGQRSYGWYLWHWPFVLLAPVLFPASGLAVTLGASLLALLMAAISFRWIEQPVRRSASLAARPAATIAAGLVLAAAGWYGAMMWERASERWEQSPEQRRFLHVTADLPRLYRFDCDDFHRDFRNPPCEFGDPAAGRTIVLAGDSIALQWFPAFERDFPADEWRIVVLTKSSCPLVAVGRDRGVTRSCDAWREAAIAYLAELGPDILVVGAGRAEGLPGAIDMVEERARLVRLTATTDRLFLFAPTPVPGFDAPACLARSTWQPLLVARPDACAARWEEVPERADALESLVRGLGNASVIDLNDTVCPHDTCRAEIDGTIVFRDRLHLSAAFAGSLAEELSHAMDGSAPR